MKVATWNVNSIRVRMPQLLGWLHSEKPDVVALQETKCENEHFPHDELLEAGYAAVHNGQKSYNGVAILARVGMDVRNVSIDIGGFTDRQKRLIAATVDGIRVISLYAVNGKTFGSDQFDYKLRWLAALQDHVEGEMLQHRDIIIAGDFNIAPAAEDVHFPSTEPETLLCSLPERAAFHELLGLGLKDAFRLFPQSPSTYTWWNLAGGAFLKNRGLRIDHILLSDNLARRCTNCLVTTSPRGMRKPSDHAPVIAELN